MASDRIVDGLCLIFNRHSKKLYAWETGPVEDMALLLLCGEADFKVLTLRFLP